MKQALFVDCHRHFLLEQFDDCVKHFDKLGLLSAWNILPEYDAWEKVRWEDLLTCIKRSGERRPVPVESIFWPDASRFSSPEYPQECVEKIECLVPLGIAGLKVWKDLGLELKNPDGSLARLDDHRLDPIWETLIKHNLLLTAHVADPKVFWLPFDESNPAYETLKRFPEWHFGRPELPTREELYACRNRLYKRYPELLTINSHFGGYAPGIEKLGEWMNEMPNFYASLGECHLESVDDDALGDFLKKHSERILFETDIALRPGQNYDAKWVEEYYARALPALCTKIGRHGTEYLEAFACKNALRLIEETGKTLHRD